MGKNEGQAALILVLVLSLVSTVAVSMAGRSINSIRSEETGNDSVKAFKAAEAGLEKLLLREKSNVTESGDLTDVDSFEASRVVGGQGGVVSDVPVDVGDVYQVLTGVAEGGSGSINVCWNSDSAIEIADYWYEGGNYGVTRYAYDSVNARGNNFTVQLSGGCNVSAFSSATFNRNVTVTLHGGSRFVRVLSLYNPTMIGVVPIGAYQLPGQKVVDSSVGTHESQGDGDSSASIKLSLTQTAGRLPAVFDNVLYTNGFLDHNN